MERVFVRYEAFFCIKVRGSLIELLAPQPGEKILDLGCGTGDLAQKIHDMQADVTGVDQSPNMIKQAEAKFPDINFLVKDATRLDFSNEFHAVFQTPLSIGLNSLKKRYRESTTV